MFFNSCSLCSPKKSTYFHTSEGVVPGHHLVETDTKSPNIHLLRAVGAPPFYKLWGHIRGSSAEKRFRHQIAGKPEIDQFQLALRVEQDIRHLEVPVAQALGMHVADGLHQPLEHVFPVIHVQTMLSSRHQKVV